MSRQGDLTKEQLENIKSFRYKTNGLTPLELTVYEPFWNFLANYCLPDWLAPNALTLLGLCFPLAILITICVLDPTLTQILPCWVWLLSWFADFWYQTVDAIDGKQARRTDNCSPLGQILDHNLDQITFTCMMIHVCSCLTIGDDVWRILLITPGVMSAHYSIEYRTHFTHMHQTVIGMIGATEQLVFVQVPTIMLFFAPSSNAALQTTVMIPVLEMEASYADIAIVFACVTGFHFNLTNLITAFLAAEDKAYALGCLLPYAQFLSMIFCSSYSSLFKDYPAYFIILCGFYLTWVTGIFNLNSTAKMKFNWLFLEPLVYFAMIYCEHSGTIDRSQAATAYVSFFAVTMLRYFLFMSNIVDQITTYMGLRFLKVKPKGTVKQE